MVEIGKIIEPPKANIREHERRTAQALARHGYVVEFVVKSELEHTKSADVFIDGVKWEMKSPRSIKAGQWEYNLKMASYQSHCVIFDSQRIKHVPDQKILAYLVERVGIQPSIKRFIFVNKRREVVDFSDIKKVK